jgi:hypothetical protein
VALLNYTTTVPAERTAAEIQGILVRAGASAVMTEYRDREVVALAFRVTGPLGERSFRLPVDPAPVLRLLLKNHARARSHAAKATPEQATRVAWRIVKDWVEAQLAIVETEMVGLDQAMLPYMTTPSGATVYEDLVAQAALPPGHAG